MTKWGLVATIKAPAAEILDFAAYHLDQGAHRLYLYLDAPNPAAYPTLKAHPKIRVATCDDAHWRKLGMKRPKKHQVRQTANATHAYARRIEVDWLIHMDVDEFLWPDRPVADILGALPRSTSCGRVRPIESLAGDGHVFKGFISNRQDRLQIVDQLYPQYGRYVKGGFLSHVAGKLFVRTGLGPLSVRIHNVFQGDKMNPGEAELDDIELCHCHSTSWEHWINAYRFRLEQGSYRAELPASQPHELGGLSLHEVLSMIESEEGQAGLRAFHDELCADTPKLRAKLDAFGLLRICDLELASKTRKHFPKNA